MHMKKAAACLLVGALLWQTGCASAPETQRDTIIGSGIGAGLGAILGNNLGNSKSDRELGIAAGALLGGLLGHTVGTQGELQNKVNNLQQNQQNQNLVTIWIQNSNGSKTPVILRKADGGQFVGPRGEYYPSLPTQDQLRPAYGM
jgi:uncharacterized protein YcfJ